MVKSKEMRCSILIFIITNIDILLHNIGDAVVQR